MRRVARSLPVPPSVEFLARCALVTRRRLLPARPHPVAARPAAAVEGPRPALGELAEVLRMLGIERGDTLMVHSSGEALERLGWDLSGVIDLLFDYLGPHGTLAMPTHPKLFQRDGRVVYNLRRSPSTVGLITELFRRRAGVVRSRFPFSSAAASGPRAEDLTSGHARSFAPHDEQSPYARLAEVGGKVLLMGCPLNRMTILHVAEDALRESLPVADFHRPVEVWVEADGDAAPVTANVRAPWLWWYLNLSGWERHLRGRGLASSRTLASVPFHVSDARRTIDWMMEEVRAGRTIYPLAWMNRWLKLGDPQTVREE